MDMNHNRWILYLTLTLIGLILTGCEKKPENGRFQIHSGVHDVVIATLGLNPTSSKEQNHVILKLDTQTGKTWMYFQNTIITSNGVMQIEGWSEITNKTFTLPPATLK